jgi:hypothetical protein
MKKNDGGPAFPTDTESQIGPNTMHLEGMSLRDYFAVKALAGMCASTDRDGTHQVYALDAYAFADAMLAVREK